MRLSQFSIENTSEFEEIRPFTANGVLALDAKFGKNYWVSFTVNNRDGFTLSVMD